METQEEKQSENKKNVSLTTKQLKQALKSRSTLPSSEINSTSNNRR